MNGSLPIIPFAAIHGKRKWVKGSQVSLISFYHVAKDRCHGNRIVKKNKRYSETIATHSYASEKKKVKKIKVKKIEKGRRK